MIAYLGCEQARELLEAFIDEELSVADQVAVESHLRWCATCAARVEDMRLISASVRLGSPIQRAAPDEAHTLNALQEGVLIRIRAEQESSLRARFVESFSDMRLWGPALGATTAMFLCVTIAFAMLHRVSTESPETLGSMFESMAPPGSEQNPLRPDNNGRVDVRFEKYLDPRFSGGISLPRVLDDGSSLAGIGGSEAVFALATVVSRDGRIANYELLPGHAMDRADATHATHVEAVRDAVRLSRFAPAQTPVGRAVAVNMVWLIVSTTTTATAQKTTRHSTAVVTPVVVEPRSTQPAAPPDAPPISQSEEPTASATA